MMNHKKYSLLGLLFLFAILFSSLKCKKSENGTIELATYVHLTEGVNLEKWHFDSLSVVVREQLLFNDDNIYRSDTGNYTIINDTLVNVIIGTSNLNFTVSESAFTQLNSKMSDSICFSKIIANDSDTLLFGRWMLNSIDSMPIDLSKGAYITIDNSTRFSGFGGCNRLGGRIFTSSPIVGFGDILSTRMACFNSDIEYQFIKALNSYFEFRIEGDTLLLNGNHNVIFIRK